MTKNSPQDLRERTYEELLLALADKESECEAAQRKIMALKREMRRSEGAFDSAVNSINLLESEIADMKARIDTPGLENFIEGVTNEVAHQRLRWPPEADAEKTPADWYWTVGYLAGKSLQASIAGDTDKAKHHCITAAALLANWHAALLK